MEMALLVVAHQEALEGLPFAAVAEGFRRVRQTNTFFPSPAEIRTEAENFAIEKRREHGRLKTISQLPNEKPRTNDDEPRPTMEQLRDVVKRSRRRAGLGEKPELLNMTERGKIILAGRKADWERCDQPDVTGLVEVADGDHIAIYAEMGKPVYRRMRQSLQSANEWLWYAAQKA